MSVTQLLMPANRAVQEKISFVTNDIHFLDLR